MPHAWHCRVHRHALPLCGFTVQQQRGRPVPIACRPSTRSGDSTSLGAHLFQSVMRHAKLISMMAFWMPYAFILAIPSGTSDSGTRCSSHWSLQAHVYGTRLASVPYNSNAALHDGSS